MAKFQYLGNDILPPIVIESNQTVYQTEAFNKSIQAVTGSGQAWKVSFQIETETPFRYFKDTVTTLGDNVTMAMPQIYTDESQNTLTNQTLTCAATAAGETDITVTASGGNGLKLVAGRFIKFSNHDKVYVLTDDATVSSLSTDVKVFPELVEAVTATTTVAYSDADVTLTAKKSLDTLNGLQFSDGKLAAPGVVTLMEQI